MPFVQRQQLLLLLHSPAFNLKNLSRNAKEFTRIKDRLNDLSLKKRHVMEVDRVKKKDSSSQAPEDVQTTQVPEDVQTTQIPEDAQTTQTTQNAQDTQLTQNAQHMQPTQGLHPPVAAREQPQKVRVPYFTIEDTLRMFLQDPKVCCFTISLLMFL